MAWYWYALFLLVLLVLVNRRNRLVGVAPFIKNTKVTRPVRANNVRPEPIQIQFGLDSIFVPGVGKRKVNISD